MTRTEADMEVSKLLTGKLKAQFLSQTQQGIYRGAGLPALLRDAHSVKPVFDALCQGLTAKLSELLGVECSFMAAPVKGQMRGAEKVNIEGLGDATTLSDAVRGTIVISCERGGLMPLIYEFLHLLVVGRARSEAGKPAEEGVRDVMSRYGAQVMQLKDRYAAPRGDYQDWNLRLRLLGFLCELQVNFDVAILLKEGSQHKEYEHIRKLHGSLLQATMLCDFRAVDKALREGAVASDESIKDAQGHSPLHYAAFHGHARMVAALLRASANPLLCDDAGRIPLGYALFGKHEGIIEQLCAQMKMRSEELSTLPEKAKVGLLLAWSKAEQEGEPHRQALSELLAEAMPDRLAQAHAAAAAGSATTLKHLLSLGINAEESQQKQPSVGGHMCRLLDQAVLAGSIETAEVCLDMGMRFSGSGVHRIPQQMAEWYVARDKGDQLAALLHVDSRKPRIAKVPGRCREVFCRWAFCRVP